jgi:hypothetical protein
MKTITATELIEKHDTELDHAPYGYEKTIREMLAAEPDTEWAIVEDEEKVTTYVARHFPITLIGDPDHAEKQAELVKRITKLRKVKDPRCQCDAPCNGPVPPYCPLHDGDYSSWLASNNID